MSIISIHRLGRPKAPYDMKLDATNVAVCSVPEGNFIADRFFKQFGGVTRVSRNIKPKDTYVICELVLPFEHEHYCEDLGNGKFSLVFTVTRKVNDKTDVTVSVPTRNHFWHTPNLWIARQYTNDILDRDYLDDAYLSALFGLYDQHYHCPVQDIQPCAAATDLLNVEHTLNQFRAMTMGHAKYLNLLIQEHYNRVFGHKLATKPGNSAVLDALNFEDECGQHCTPEVDYVATFDLKDIKNHIPAHVEKFGRNETREADERQKQVDAHEPSSLTDLSKYTLSDIIKRRSELNLKVTNLLETFMEAVSILPEKCNGFRLDVEEGDNKLSIAYVWPPRNKDGRINNCFIGDKLMVSVDDFLVQVVDKSLEEFSGDHRAKSVHINTVRDRTIRKLRGFAASVNRFLEDNFIMDPREYGFVDIFRSGETSMLIVACDKGKHPVMTLTLDILTMARGSGIFDYTDDEEDPSKELRKKAALKAEKEAPVETDTDD